MVRGLNSDTMDHSKGCLSRTRINVEELLDDVIVGLKVKRESVTMQIVHLLNLVIAGEISLDEKGFGKAIRQLEVDTSELSIKAQEIIAIEVKNRSEEVRRRAQQLESKPYPDDYVLGESVVVGRHGN